MLRNRVGNGQAVHRPNISRVRHSIALASRYEGNRSDSCLPEGSDIRERNPGVKGAPRLEGKWDLVQKRLNDLASDFVLLILIILLILVRATKKAAEFIEQSGD